MCVYGVYLYTNTYTYNIYFENIYIIYNVNIYEKKHFIYACMYVYLYIHKYTHTHTHAHIYILCKQKHLL